MNEEKLKKLQTILKEINEGITREEFVNAFKEVVKIVKDLQETNKKEFELIHEFTKKFSGKIQSDTSMTLADMKRQVNQIFVGERMNAMQKMIDESVKEAMDKMHGKMTEIDKKMASVRDGYTPVKGKDYFDGKDANIVTPEQTVTKINHAENKIKKSQIEGLEDEIKSLRKELATKAASGSRRVFQPYVDDFSAQTNGSTKIFYLSREPLKTGSVMVYGTDFPTILRPTIDFTIVGKTLTLTSAVPAPNTGATLICTFFA